MGMQVGTGLDEQLHALEPLRINRQPLAFSNPQPTAFPSHTLDVSAIGIVLQSLSFKPPAMYKNA